MRDRTGKVAAVVLFILLFAAVGAAQLPVCQVGGDGGGVSSQSDWNSGTFDNTSADRDDNSGNLGMGWLNGSNPSASGLESGLLGYWRFDRDSGDVLDYSGAGRDGSFQQDYGGHRGVTGVFGTDAFEFDGGDNAAYVDLDQYGDDNAFDTASGAVSFWTNPGDQPLGGDGGEWGIISTFRQDTTDNYWRILVNTNIGFAAVHIRINDAWEMAARTPDDSFTKGEWNHVVIQQPGNNVEIWVDGEQQTLTDQFGAIARDKWWNDVFPASWDFRIADRGSWTNGHYNGTIDEFRMYNRSLSENEIHELYLDGTDSVFEGSYTSDVLGDGSVGSWDFVDVAASVPAADVEVSMTFRALDDQESVVDTEVFTVINGQETYELEVTDSEYAQVVFTGNSTDEEKTWVIEEFSVGSEDWVFTEDCKFNTTQTAPANVEIRNNAVVTITSTGDLGIDLYSFYLMIREGSGLLIEYGGTLVQRIKASLTVETNEATDVGENNATLHGNLTELVNADSADVWFKYGENDLNTETSKTTLGTTSTFSETIDGLNDDTEYDFRAVAEADDGTTVFGTIRSFITEASIQIIEDFESYSSTSDLWNVYSTDDANAFELQSSVVYEGSNALELVPGVGGTDHMYSDTLDNLPVRGDTFAFHMYRSALNGDRPRIMFAVQSDNFYWPDGYFLEFRDDRMRLAEVSGGSFNPDEFSNIYTPNTGQWDRVEIEFDVDSDGDITVTHYDGDSDTVQGSVTINSNAHNSGGWAWVAASSATSTFYWDYALIVD